MDREKIYWKIEALWGRYFSLLLRGIKQSLYHHDNLKKIHTLYKNNISRYNPDFHFVEQFDFSPSEKIVHFDNDGEYFGLEKSQVLEKDRKLVYLFDNHNKIIQPFLEYAEITGKGFDVVHIDAHDDDAVFAKQKPHHLSIQKGRNYITQTRISDFFDFLSLATLQETKQSLNKNKSLSLQNMKQYCCKFFSICHCERQRSSLNIRTIKLSLRARAKQSILSKIDSSILSLRGMKQSFNKNKSLSLRGTKQSPLIKNIHHYTKSNDFQEFKKPKNHYILSLDIDIFGPEGGFVDMESKIKIIAKAWKNAEVICIATSPGFIDQKYAQRIIEIFIK